VAKETAVEEVAASRTAANEVMAEEAAASRATADVVATEEAATARALSSQVGQGESHEAIEEAVEEAPVGAGRQGSQEIAAGATSDAASEPGEGTGTLVPEEKNGEAADLTCTGANASPGDASQVSPAARAEEIGRSKATIAPDAAAKGTPGGKTSTAPTDSRAGSQSSAGQL
jgi:hypothetical protein